MLTFHFLHFYLRPFYKNLFKDFFSKCSLKFRNNLNFKSEHFISRKLGTLKRPHRRHTKSNKIHTARKFRWEKCVFFFVFAQKTVPRSVISSSCMKKNDENYFKRKYGNSCTRGVLFDGLNFLSDFFLRFTYFNRRFALSASSSKKASLWQGMRFQTRLKIDLKSFFSWNPSRESF